MRRPSAWFIMAAACSVASIVLVAASSGALAMYGLEFSGHLASDSDLRRASVAVAMPGWVALWTLVCVIARRPLLVNGWSGFDRGQPIQTWRMVVAAFGFSLLGWLWMWPGPRAASALENGDGVRWSFIGGIVAGALAWSSTLFVHMWWQGTHPRTAAQTMAQP